MNVVIPEHGEDEGHTLDFTNKAFEVLEHLGWERAADVLPMTTRRSAVCASA
jgi:hypothetical protein